MNPARLFLTSAAVLFCELLLIRWTHDRLMYLGFFSNFVLMASFLGIGLGILLGRSSRTPWSALAGPLLLALVVAVHLAEPRLREAPTDGAMFGLEAAQLRRAAVVAGVVALAAGVMAAIALPLGPLLRSMPPLRAYAIDIGGALAGIVLAFALSLLWMPPVVWFGVLGALLLALALGSIPRLPALAGVALLAPVLAAAWAEAAAGDVWSPYQRVSFAHGHLASYTFAGEERAYGEDITAVGVGGVVNEQLWRAALVTGTYYDEVFRQLPTRRFERALVIGAGGGTDVAVALAAGVGRVDAVEIDPVLLGVGGSRHPDRPYADPRVRTYADDGRAFLERARERYDLVVLAQVGSRAHVAAQANVRLDSFLFTVEAFRLVRERLTADGVFVVYWIKDAASARRTAATLEAAFGEAPLARTYPEGDATAYTFFAGPGARELTGRLVRVSEGGALVTDDWPFPHLAGRGIPAPYAVGLAALLAAAALSVGAALRRRGARIGELSPHFFLLGVAFLLLQTRSLVTFGLLFGTTWLVNALVFFAVLVSVLLAIAVSAAVRVPRTPLYSLLVLSLVANYALPPSALLIDPPVLRYALASALAFAPVFLANLAFASSFRSSRAADLAFASNLLGAVVGGVLEWTALVTGYQAQVILIVAIYALAYVAAHRVRVGADRDLAPAGQAGVGRDPHGPGLSR